MKLTDKEKDALFAIRKGADILSHDLAKTLRGLERKAPHLLTICKPMGQYEAHERLPYFGALLSTKGKQALRAIRGHQSRLQRSMQPGSQWVFIANRDDPDKDPWSFKPIRITRCDRRNGRAIRYAKLSDPSQPSSERRVRYNELW